MSQQIDFLKNVTEAARLDHEGAVALLRTILIEVVKSAPSKYLAMLGDCTVEMDYQIYKEANK